MHTCSYPVLLDWPGCGEPVSCVPWTLDLLLYPCIALTLVLKPGTMMARNISVGLALPEPLQNRDARTGGSYPQCSLRWALPLKGASQSSSPLAGDWQQGSSGARRLDSSFIPGRELPSVIKCRGPGWQCLFQWWCFCTINTIGGLAIQTIPTWPHWFSTACDHVVWYHYY